MNLFAERDAELKAELSGDEEKDKTEEEKHSPQETEEKPEDTEESSEGDTEETEEQDEETTDDDQESEDEPKAKVREDNDIVKVKVGDQEHDVKVSDLKRLYGQEKALTQRSMEVSNRRKELDNEGAKYVAGSEALLNRAVERFKPYENIDWALAVKELDTETYKSLRAGAQAAWEDVNFYKNELDGYMSHVGQQRHNHLVEEAKATLKELSDPDKGIKGFNEKIYGDMRKFAVGKGIPQDMMDTLVSAPALRIIHMAMMFEKGQGKTIVTKPTAKSPKTILKSKNAPGQVKSVMKPQAGQAMKNLKTSGREQDAANAFLERWGTRDED
jgi:hypothetical protein